MITADELKGTRMKRTMHLDVSRGPKGSSVDWYRGLAHPRLEQKVTNLHAQKLSVRKLFVDGIEVDGLEAAAAALNQPAPADATSANPFQHLADQMDANRGGE